MEGWVKEWIEKERKAGRTCFEVKQVKGHYYVYHATTTYDREQHKARKVAEYLGKLDPKEGIDPPKKTKIERPHTIWRYGDAALVHQVFKDLMPVLEKAFPYDWREVAALAMLRTTDYLPMKRVASAFRQVWFDVAGLEPGARPAPPERGAQGGRPRPPWPECCLQGTGRSRPGADIRPLLVLL